MTKIKTMKTTQTDVQPDFVTPLEAQAILDASLDMLDALECLIAYQGDVEPDDFDLDVWKNTIAAVKKAGGVDYSRRGERSQERTELAHDDWCRLSICFGHGTDYRTEQDRRINEYLKAEIEATNPLPEPPAPGTKDLAV